MKKYYIKKQWRAVGACEFDVFFRDIKRALTEIDTVGKPEEVFAVLEANGRTCTEEDPHAVIADCYSRADAVLVRDALNRGIK